MEMLNTGNFQIFNGETRKILPPTLKFIMTSCGQWTSKGFFSSWKRLISKCALIGVKIQTVSGQVVHAPACHWNFHGRQQESITGLDLPLHSLVPVCTTSWRQVLCLEHNTIPQLGLEPFLLVQHANIRL